MKNLLFVLISILLFSCSSSNDVVSGSFLQKRKYKKGYHLSFKKASSKTPSDVVVLEKEQTGGVDIQNELHEEIVANERALEEKAFEVQLLKTVHVELESVNRASNVVYKSAIENAIAMTQKEKNLVDEELELKENYKTSSYLSAIAMLLFFPFIVGFRVLAKIKSFDKEKINASKILNKQAKETFWLALTGFVLFLGIVALVLLSSLAAQAMAFGGYFEMAFALILLIMLLGILKTIFRSVANLLQLTKAVDEDKMLYYSELTEGQRRLKKHSLLLLMIGAVGFISSVVIPGMLFLTGISFIIFLVSFFMFFRVFKTNNYKYLD